MSQDRSLQLLQRALPGEGGDARLRRCMDVALGQVRLLGELVQDLTDVVRLQNNTFAVERVPLDLGQVVDTSIELAQPITHEQIIQCELPSVPTLVRGDARRLQQVLLNLLANAVQHAPGTPTIDVRLRTAADAAILEVHDQGPGIPREERERLFAPFHKVARPGRRGLGLGLHIAHEIVAAHEGTITVESSAGQGTTFVVRLPLAAGANEELARA
jgi:signal transduction histidine kinase